MLFKYYKVLLLTDQFHAGLINVNSNLKKKTISAVDEFVFGKGQGIKPENTWR